MLDPQTKKDLTIKSIDLAERLKEIHQEENQIRSLLGQAKALSQDKPRDQFDQEMTPEEIAAIKKRFDKNFADFEAKQKKQPPK